MRRADEHGSFVLDTDVDENAFATRPSYLCNYITRGTINSVADDESYAPTYREPGTHGTLVAGAVSVVEPNVLLWIGRIAFANSRDTRAVDADFLALGLTAASFADPPFDVINVSIVEPRYEHNVQHGAADFTFLTWALKKLVDRGTIVNAATGNDAGARIDGDVGYPARVDTVTAVGSIAWDGTRSRFSRFGGTKPDIVAVGDRPMTPGTSPKQSAVTVTSRPTAPRSRALLPPASSLASPAPSR